MSDQPLESTPENLRLLEAKVSDLERTIASLTHESEVRYGALIENIPNCVIAIVDEDLRFVFAGGKGLEAVGLRPRDLVGKHLRDLLSPEQMDLVGPRLRAAFDGEVANFEIAYRPDVIFASTAAPLREGQGHIARVITHSINITNRRLADLRIQRLNRTYAVMSGINELMVRERNPKAILDGACRIALEAGGFRAAWICLTEKTSDALQIAASAGMDSATMEIVKEFIGAEHPCRFTMVAVREGVHAVCNDIEHDPGAEQWRDAALQRRYRSMVSLPLRNSGKFTGAFNLYSEEKGFFDREELRLLDDLAADISFALEACENETERQKATERLSLLIENVSDIITVINNQGVIRFQSPSVSKVLGYSPDEMVGIPAFEFIHPDDATVTAAAIERCVSQPDIPVAVEYRLRHKDGEWRFLQSVGRSAPGLSEEGFIVVTSRDVTEKRQLEEQLRQSQKMEAIGQLAGGVAHDFNNILAAMLMRSELIADAPGASDEIRHGMREIRNAAERAANLTRQLLLFSRRQMMQPRPIDLNDIVTSLTQLLQRIIGEDVQLQLHLNPTPLIARADPGMLDQVLLNLAVNARDAMPSGGTVLIETLAKTVHEKLVRLHGDANPGRYVGFSVSDTGGGIAPEILPRIFEPFFTTKEAGKGTGLGLATVFGIVKQHNGWLDVRSEPGQGSCFQIFIPATDSDPTQGTTPSATAARGSEGILLVEDEGSVRALSRVILKRHGYTVFEAANGPEALEVWRKNAANIALLFTDLVMPMGMTGLQLAQELRKERPDLRVVFASGYSSEIAGREASFRLGENFLQKPFSQNELLSAVRRRLDSPVNL